MGKVIIKIKRTNLADLFVQRRKFSLIGNPEHGGQQMTEQY
jgi:hypothetical protein